MRFPLTPLPLAQDPSVTKLGAGAVPEHQPHCVDLSQPAQESLVIPPSRARRPGKGSRGAGRAGGCHLCPCPEWCWGCRCRVCSRSPPPKPFLCPASWGQCLGLLDRRGACGWPWTQRRLCSCSSQGQALALCLCRWLSPRPVRKTRTLSLLLPQPHTPERAGRNWLWPRGSCRPLFPAS